MHDTPSSEHGTLPLRPIDRPQGFVLRLLFGAYARRYGRVPTAFRVLYPRSPYLALLSLLVYLGLTRFVRLEAPLCALVQTFVALESGCTFCADLHLAEAARLKVGRERFAALLQFEASPHFTPRERAALTYARALARSLHVPDETWALLSTHFTERERVDLVWVCAVERYYNSMALPLRIGSDRLAPP